MLRPWDLSISIARDSGTAIHLQIVQKIIEEIDSGRFQPGAVLPGTRALAKKINVNRKTVIQAYDELIAQGLLTSEHKRGTFVANRVLTIQNIKHPNIASNNQSPSLHKILDYGNTRLSKKQASEFIHFSDGIPDARLIPLEVISRAMRHALNVSARNNRLGYTNPKGSLLLREALVDMLNSERALYTNSEKLCIVRGSQMGIFILGKLLANTNGFIVMEELCNPMAREAFKNCGAKTLKVLHDHEGIDTQHLEELCIIHPISAVYVTPNHQIPTTVRMSDARKSRLIELSDKYGFYIIEDDSDHEFCFNNTPALPIASLSKSDNIIYIGSMSKVLSPNFRVGYIVSSEEITNLCANQAMLIDRQGNQITELAIAELLHTGEIKRHQLRALKVYTERRALVTELLNSNVGDSVSFNAPQNGLAFWLELNHPHSISRLILDAETHKVKFMPGERFTDDHQDISAIRLGFANLNHDEIAIGITRLKNAFANQLNQFAA